MGEGLLELIIRRSVNYKINLGGKNVKKKLILVFTMVCLLAISGTLTAAPAFPEVPADHWAYNAVARLVSAGLISGYDESNFRQDRALNRYEFAIMAAKALERVDTASAEDKKLIDKLSAEFGTELELFRLGSRVAKLESQANINSKAIGDIQTKTEKKAAVDNKTNFWFGGDTRFRFVTDTPASNGANVKALKGADKMEFRQRVKFGATINENMALNGRLSTVGGNKFGNTDYNWGSEISLDIANVTMKNLFGLKTFRVGRSALDFYTSGLIAKPMDVDGVLLTKTLNNNSELTVWNGNIKSGTNGDANTLTTAEMTVDVDKNLKAKLGYYWADVPGTSTGTGTGTLNTNVGSYASSQGFSTGFQYKLGEYTVLFDYVGTRLSGASRLPSNPRGWAIQFSNSKGAPVFYSALPLVNPEKAGTDAWMVSYRSVDAGAIPNGAGGFDPTAVSYANQPYSVTAHGTDNIKAWFFAYQSVLAKNFIISFEYQDLQIKNRGLTALTSDGLNKTFMTKLEFFY